MTSKGKSHGADAQGSDEGGNVVVPLLRHHDEGQGHAQDVGQRGEQAGQGLVHFDVGAAHQVEDEPFPGVAKGIEAREGADDEAAAQDLVDGRMLRQDCDRTEDAEGIQREDEEEGLNRLVERLQQVIQEIVLQLVPQALQQAQDTELEHQQHDEDRAGGKDGTAPHFPEQGRVAEWKIQHQLAHKSLLSE